MRRLDPFTVADFLFGYLNQQQQDVIEPRENRVLRSKWAAAAPRRV
jgi:hypothetical protein